MREPAASESPRATTFLIIAGITCFAFFNILLQIDKDDRLKNLLYLSSDGLGHGYIWQLLTFQFLHLNLLHLLMNMLSLYVFGRIVEDQIGVKRFLQLYFTAGLLGGLAQVLLGLVSSKFSGYIFGASAGVFGVIAAFGLLLWYDHFKAMVFFFLPVNMTGQFVFWLALASSVIGLALAGISTSNGAQVAHAAHLGGFFAAFLFVKRGSAYSDYQLPFFKETYQRRQPATVRANSGNKDEWWKKQPAQPVREPEEVSEDFISKEVDPILDKISQKGIHSLTEQERKILEKARSKMSKK